MTKVLVTGGNGQLGKSLESMIDQYPDFEFKFIDIEDLDICSTEKTEQYFKEYKPDFCINTAAYTAVDKAEEDTQKAFDVNANGAKNLALACKAHNTILIHISTDFVFDGFKTIPYTEEDKPNPISVYGESKLKGEKNIQDIWLKHIIIRTSWLYSEHGTNFMKTMLGLAETRDELSVVSDQLGSPTYAGDLAQVILKLITSAPQEYGIYHYSNEGVASWYDFAKAIFEVSNTNITLNAITTALYPTPAKRPSHSVLDKEKITRTLNIEIPYWKTSLKLAIKKMAN